MNFAPLELENTRLHSYLGAVCGYLYPPTHAFFHKFQTGYGFSISSTSVQFVHVVFFRGISNNDLKSGVIHIALNKAQEVLKAV